MLLEATIEWTTVLVALIAALPGILATIFAFLIHRAIRTPSGDPIGHVAERTHDLAAVNTAKIDAVHKIVNGGATDA